MKKMFLMLAFTGIVGASVANTLSVMNNTAVITLSGDKKGDDKKKKEDEKAKACHDGKDEKAGCAGGSKSCCKSKAKAEASTNEKSAEVKAVPAATTPAAVQQK